jgi:hypothetical protein
MPEAAFKISTEKCAKLSFFKNMRPETSNIGTLLFAGNVWSEHCKVFPLSQEHQPF